MEISPSDSMLVYQIVILCKGIRIKNAHHAKLTHLKNKDAEFWLLMIPFEINDYIEYIKLNTWKSNKVLIHILI